MKGRTSHLFCIIVAHIKLGTFYNALGCSDILMHAEATDSSAFLPSCSMLAAFNLEYM